MRHVIPISGKDSLCTALVQMARDDSLPYEFIFLDVQMELPETYEWLDQVEKQLGIKIVRLGKSLEDVIAHHNILPSMHMRFCTREAKIQPMLKYLGKDDQVTQYLGIRADEGVRAEGWAAAAPNVTNKFPLIECGIDLHGVYEILGAKCVLPPTFFWQRLYDLVWECTPDVGREYILKCRPWIKQHLFAGRSRSNCFMCFGQRLYEWVWLSDVHPDLFVKAQEMEQEYGHQPDRVRKGSYYWRADGQPLWRVRERAAEIIKKRALDVREAVRRGVYSVKEDELDVLAVKSCGAYCGK